MRKILDILSIVAVVLAVLYISFSIRNMPAVYWSVTKDSCTRIEVSNSVISCSELPSLNKYELIYVE